MSKPLPAPKITSTDRLGMTLFIAIVLHGIVILGVTFTAHLRKQHNQQKPLDIVIVHTRSEQAPKDAKNIAQFNQQASGRSDTPDRPSDLLAALTPTQKAGRAPVAKKAVQQQQEQAAQQKILVSRDSVTRVITQDSSQQKQQTPQPDLKTTQQRHMEMARLAAEISKKEKRYAQRPRVHFVDAMSAKSDIAAQYMDAWVKRVKSIGNLNYPDEARIRKISGKLTLHVLLDDQGKVLKIMVAVSSGNKVLDDAAINIVRIASPFPAFQPEMRAKYDQLMITRTWEFHSGG